MKKRLIDIAIDHGNRMQKVVYPDGKVEDFIFSSGLTKSSDEPLSNSNVVKYNDNYYTVGNGRIAVQTEKWKHEENFIFTLAALGNYIKATGENDVEIRLSVGLPLLNYSTQKEKFKEYFLREDIVFDYEELKGLKISIVDCYVWPQSYSSMVNRTGYRQASPIGIDIGGYTIDICSLIPNGSINPGSIVSKSNGIINLCKTVQSELYKKGYSIEDSQIDQILMDKEQVIFDEEVPGLVEKYAEEYVSNLLADISEEYELKLNPVCFIGGASLSLRKFIEKSDYVRYFEFDDIFGNARGYSKLTKALLEQREKKHEE